MQQAVAANGCGKRDFCAEEGLRTNEARLARGRQPVAVVRFCRWPLRLHRDALESLCLMYATLTGLPPPAVVLAMHPFIVLAGRGGLVSTHLAAS